MKRFYPIAVLLLIPFSSMAQISKNTYLVGGQLYYYSEMLRIDSFDQHLQSGTIALSVGKTFKENSAVGIKVAYSPAIGTNYLNWNDTADLHFNQLNAGIFFREYKKLATDLYFFGHVEGGYSTTIQKEEYYSDASVRMSRKGGFIGLTPGISYRVFKKMQLELTLPNILGIQYIKTRVRSEHPNLQNWEREEWMAYSNLTTNTGLGFLGIGFNFLF